MKCKRGFTLIELLLTLVLITLVIVPTMTFFISSINNSTKIKTNAELQFQAQYILNFVSEKAMESKNVEMILTGSPPRSKINSKEEETVSKILFRYGQESNQCHIFEVKEVKRKAKIFYGKGKSSDLASDELGIYIKELKIKPYPVGKSFAEATGLRITVVMIKGDEKYEASQLIYMRLS